MRLRHPDRPDWFGDVPRGLGSIEVRGPLPPGYRFPCCGRKALKGEGLLIYIDDDSACVKCARAWVAENYPPPLAAPTNQPPEQAALFQDMAV